MRMRAYVRMYVGAATYVRMYARSMHALHVCMLVYEWHAGCGQMHNVTNKQRSNAFCYDMRIVNPCLHCYLSA